MQGKDCLAIAELEFFNHPKEIHRKQYARQTEMGIFQLGFLIENTTM
jgi:hypothetical protein